MSLQFVMPATKQFTETYDDNTNTYTIVIKNKKITYDYDFMKSALEVTSKEHELAQYAYNILRPILMKHLQNEYYNYEPNEYKIDCLQDALRRYNPNSFKRILQEIDEENKIREKQAKELQSKLNYKANLIQSMLDIGFIDY